MAVKRTASADPVDRLAVLTIGSEGIRLRVRVKPGASRAAILGRTRLVDDEIAVLIAVTAVPEAGKANEAVTALLAKALRVPKTSISVATGASARTKILDLRGAPTELASRVSAWLEALPIS